MSGSLPTRSLSQHLRQSSHQGQSPALLARIEEKKAELENLRELRDLSAAVAGQMEALQQRLATMSDGTEAIAAVVSNWHNVLRAINMASSKVAKLPARDTTSQKEGGDDDDGSPPLPQTLVRIPTEHAPTVQAHAEADTSATGAADPGAGA